MARTSLESFQRGVYASHGTPRQWDVAYSTQRILVKDTSTISHCTIICSYLKLGGTEATWGAGATYTRKDGWFESPTGVLSNWELKAMQLRNTERGWDEGLYVSPVIWALLWPSIFPDVRVGEEITITLGTTNIALEGPLRLLLFMVD